MYCMHEIYVVSGMMSRSDINSVVYTLHITACARFTVLFQIDTQALEYNQCGATT